MAATVAGASACTPKPDVADAAAATFLTRLVERGNAAEMTDSPDIASAIIDDTWTNLQAERLSATVKEVHTVNDQATATFTMDWQLPGDRHFVYDSSMKLTKTSRGARGSGGWQVRWQPSVMHPELGVRQHLELRPVPARKATVVGSDGAVLLEPGRQWRVLIDPQQVGDVRSVLSRINEELRAIKSKGLNASLFDVSAKVQEAQQVSGVYSVTVVDNATGLALRDALTGLAGVRFNEESTLVRPDPSFAPDIMARVADIVAGDLDGERGWKVVAATEEGNEVARVGGENPVPAASVHVSLSRRVQEAAQAAVDTRSDAKTMMVVLRPSSGEILAVAQTKKADQEGDVALMGQYPPGSTFKMITAYAGMEKQGLKPGATVGCPGSQNIGGRIVRNYNGFSLGNTPLENAFAKSCNTTFADISAKLAPGELQRFASRFGLGQDFEIEGLQTLTGSVPKGEVLLSRTESGYGQGEDLASPFGMALVAATAAKGEMPVPWLVSGENHRTGLSGPVPEPLNPQVVAGLRQLMRAVVTNGSGVAAKSSGEVFAKTGEAEVNQGSHSWFAGYRGDLAFATLIVLGGGSEHAVKVTNEFFRQIDKG